MKENKVRVTVSLPEQIADMFKRRSKQMGMSMSEYVMFMVLMNSHGSQK